MNADQRRRKAARNRLDRSKRAPAMVRVEVTLPRVLRTRLEVVRLVNGRSLASFITVAVERAVDEVLLHRPGLLWARPGAPIYADAVRAGHVGAPIGEACGGERVLVLARLEGVGPWPVLAGDGPEAETLQASGYLCDLIPSDTEGVSLRRVVLRACDAIVLPPPTEDRGPDAGAASRP